MTVGRDTDIQWIKFGEVESISFIGKETIVLGYGNYIIFYDNARPEKKELIYRATNDLKGDGVQCLCTHRTLLCFAMAEKCRNPRILINSYPGFENMKTIEAFQDTAYIALGFSEMEYLVALTGLPNYSIVVWNWRTLERLYVRETNVHVPKQLLRVSLTMPIQIAQAAPKERTLLIWDFNMCYKKAVLSDFRVNVPEKSQPPYWYAWGYDGELYFSDSFGNLFSVSSDSRSCELILGWRGEEGKCYPSLTWYKGGWVYNGPGKVQYCRRKSPEGWTRIWSITPSVPFKMLVSSTLKDVLYGWNEMHELVLFKGDTNVECTTMKSYGCDFDFICLLQPLGDLIVTYSKSRKIFTLWNKITGALVSTLDWDKPGNVNDVKANPVFPYVLVVQSTGKITAINMYDPLYSFIFSEIYLTREPIDTVRFHPSGSRFCVGNMEIGEIFLVKLYGDPNMDVAATAKLDLKIVNFALMGDASNTKLAVLAMSQLCCRSGHTLLIYSVNQHKKIFHRLEDVTVPIVLTSIVPKNETELFCIPHRSRAVYIVTFADGKVVEKMVSGHQMKSFSIKLYGEYLTTFGFDGIAILRSAKTMQCITVVAPNHRMAKGIKDALVDPYCQNIVTLGADGSLVSFAYNGSWNNLEARTDLEGLMKTSPFKQLLYVPLMTVKAKAKALEKLLAQTEVQKLGISPISSDITKTFEVNVQKTWLEMRELEKAQQDEANWREERLSLITELGEIRSIIKELLNENLEMPPKEQLPISAFDLDKPNRRKMMEDSKAEREKERHMQLATVKARDKVSEYIKKLCWDSILVKGRELHGIMSTLKVESYPLTKPAPQEKEDMYWRSQRLKLEQYYRRGDYFEPWIPKSASTLDLQINTNMMLSEVNVTLTLKTRFEEDELGEQGQEGEKLDKLSRLLWSGTSTHNFIEVSDYHFSQFEITGNSQIIAEIHLISEDVRSLMMWFNKEFEDVSLIKEREVVAIVEKHNRFRHIINELNFFHFSPKLCKTVILDPKWDPYEQPERIMRVEDSEMSISPYITQSQQELIDKKLAEEERLRQLLLADDFKERALIVMMDGVLEKLWESEIKKDVPKPRCMLEKESENYTEDDLRAIKAYEEATRFLQNERERYRKILEADWMKIQASVKDTVNRFDDKLSKLHLLKMRVDSAICQEMLKVLRMRQKMQEKLEMTRKEENLKEEMAKNEKKIESLQQDVAKFTETLNECKTYYENLQNRDKNLDKNFKKEFPDLSPIICDQLYKISKKRPKALQRAALFSSLLLDLGKCTVSGCKPDYLTAECIQYLKDIDNLDNMANAPASISEQTWELMCKMRRTKIECEMKVRACAVELGEAEATVSAYQKRLKNTKEYQMQLQNDMQNLRQERLFLSQDYDIQLVLKSGLVEIPLSGRISDFEECILVTRETLLEINGIITKVGNHKIKAMKKAANFRKGIIFKEWEHKKLRMEIEDLQSKLKTVEKIKVTKELQSILVARARGFTDEKGFLYMEEELAAAKERFQKTQLEIFRQIDEYNAKIEKLSIQNEELDLRIAELNVDVNELSMEIDKHFDEKQFANNMKRMKKIRYRGRLVRKIQEQHNDILMLQTELELLRLRTFPTLKNKS